MFNEILSSNIVDRLIFVHLCSNNIFSEIIIVKIIGINIILKLGLNFSFEAILLMYVNRISSPPISIKNIIMGIHDLFMDFASIMVIINVCIIRIIPIDIGVISDLIIDGKIIMILIINIFISTNILS